MQRNTLFGGLALLAAGGLIGAGAMVSSNAMADTPAAADTANELTMINVGPDGEAVKCTFTGADAAAMMPDIGLAPVPVGAGVPAGAATGSGVLTVTAGAAGEGAPIEIDPNNPPPGVVVGSAVVGASGVVDAQGLPTLDSLPAGVQILSADDAREGTPEECAAMRDTGLFVAGGAVGGATASVSVTGEATKP